MNNHHIELPTVTQRGQSILAVPIHSADHQRVIGVFQLINKLDGSNFTKNDEQIFEVIFLYSLFYILSVILWKMRFSTLRVRLCVIK